MVNEIHVMQCNYFAIKMLKCAIYNQMFFEETNDVTHVTHMANSSFSIHLTWMKVVPLIIVVVCKLSYN